MARNMTEPAGFWEIAKCPDKAEWHKAMDAEYDGLIDAKTWVLVPPTDVPQDDITIGNTWVYRVKYDEHNQPFSRKARLCARGDQEKRVSRDETFAPTGKPASLRLLVAIATAEGWAIHQMDVKTAFLNGYLKKPIYMRQPAGYVIKGKENWICKLVKSLYGVTVAPRAWNERLVVYLKQIGFVPCSGDACLFRRLASNGAITVVYAHVDDLAITGTVILPFKKEMEAAFKMLMTEGKPVSSWGCKFSSNPMRRHCLDSGSLCGDIVLARFG